MSEMIWSDTDLLNYLCDYVGAVRFPDDGSCELYLMSGDVLRRQTLRDACRDALAGADPNIPMDEDWNPPVRNDLNCPCGNALVRGGETVKSHWTGAICEDCESQIFEKARLRVAHPDEAQPDGSPE